MRWLMLFFAVVVGVAVAQERQRPPCEKKQTAVVVEVRDGWVFVNGRRVARKVTRGPLTVVIMDGKVYLNGREVKVPPLPEGRRGAPEHPFHPVLPKLRQLLRKHWRELPEEFKKALERWRIPEALRRLPRELPKTPEELMRRTERWHREMVRRFKQMQRLLPKEAKEWEKKIKEWLRRAPEEWRKQFERWKRFIPEDVRREVEEWMKRFPREKIRRWIRRPVEKVKKVLREMGYTVEE